MEYCSLVRNDPAVAGTNSAVAGGSPAMRSAALMNRVCEAFAAGRKLRSEYGGPLGFTGWSFERERFMAGCESALSDLDEILVARPRSQEAPEAMYTVVQIKGYPNHNEFDEALEVYRWTFERYPGTRGSGRPVSASKRSTASSTTERAAPTRGRLPGPNLRTKPCQGLGECASERVGEAFRCLHPRSSSSRHAFADRGGRQKDSYDTVAKADAATQESAVAT
jgi:hypothetical protein